MTELPLHPEDLFDRARKGTLSELDRDALTRHAVTCGVCRLEWRLIQFQARDLLEGLDQDDSHRAVDGALHTLRGELGAAGPLDLPRSSQPEWSTTSIDGKPPRGGRAGRRQGAPRGRKVLGLLAAVLLGAGAAVAAQALLGPRPHTPLPREEAATTAARSAEMPSIPLPPKTRDARVSEAAAPAARIVPHRPPSSATLLARANAARAAGAVATAERLYRELQRRYPGEHETSVSYAALGRLLLEQGRDAAAVAAFSNAISLEPLGAPLREAALVGLAQALERAGRAAEARAAWRQLVREAPDSLHAEQARQRAAAP